MHGRVKVRTTAEQQEAKRKERAKKLQAYQEINAKIFKKRADSEYDDNILELTEKVLSSDPDVMTMWIIRREAIENRQDDDKASVVKHERRLTESCLGVNPKSYCAWLHRKWILLYADEADWEEEVRLCNTFLKYDERNFHCWDYRRFVVMKAGVEPEKEFQFSLEKIMDNFSNYSGWHYRSKLLPLVHPHSDGKERPAESALLKEYQLVQNAVFTDPYDQSAWFYHRWLLGRAESLPHLSCVLAQKTDTCTFFYAALAKPVEVFPAVLTVDGKECKVEWKCFHSSSSPLSSYIWESSVDSTLLKEIVVRADFKDAEEIAMSFESDEAVSCYGLGNSQHLFRNMKTESTTAVLSAELESCNQLLDLEPGNKWTLLTVVFLMAALDLTTHKDAILAHLANLVSVDPYRKGYYQDLKTRFTIENSIESCFNGDCTSLCLKGQGLTRLYHTHHLLFITELDVSSNGLLTLRGCENLLRLSVLIADGNEISEIHSSLAHLIHLFKISLDFNKISLVESLEGLRATKIEKLSIRENPLSAKNLDTSIKALIPCLQILEL